MMIIIIFMTITSVSNYCAVSLWINKKSAKKKKPNEKFRSQIFTVPFPHEFIGWNMTTNKILHRSIQNPKWKEIIRKQSVILFSLRTTKPIQFKHHTNRKRQFVQIIRQKFSQQNCPSYMIDVACDTEQLNARRTRSCKSADLLSLFDTLSLQYWLHGFCRRRRCRCRHRRQQRHRSSSVCACAAYP